MAACVLLMFVRPARRTAPTGGPDGAGWVLPGRGRTVEVRLPEPGDALTGVELFAGLEPEVRQRVIAAAVPRTYRKGQLLFVENDPGESLIVLKRGAVVHTLSDTDAGASCLG